MLCDVMRVLVEQQTWLWEKPNSSCENTLGIISTHTQTVAYIHTHTLTSYTEGPEAKLQAVQHYKAVGGVQLTSLLRVALKITGALPQPQLPDLPYVDCRRERERKERLCCMNANMHNHKSHFGTLFISVPNTQKSAAEELNKYSVFVCESPKTHTNISADCRMSATHRCLRFPSTLLKEKIL